MSKVPDTEGGKKHPDPILICGGCGAQVRGSVGPLHRCEPHHERQSLERAREFVREVLIDIMHEKPTDEAIEEVAQRVARAVRV